MPESFSQPLSQPFDELWRGLLRPDKSELASMHQCGYFYMMTNAHNSVLYCGATIDLYNRVLEHRNNIFQNSFTSRYNIDKLVYFETYTFAGDAFKEKGK